MTTKASQIMALHAKGKSTREIALEVYGEAIDKRMAYVRIVVRQRNGHQSSTDARYLMKRYNARSVREANRIKSAERYLDPVYRNKQIERYRRYRQNASNQASA